MKRWGRRIAALFLFVWAAYHAWRMIQGYTQAKELSSEIDRLKSRKAARKEDINHARRELQKTAEEAAKSKEKIEAIRERVRDDLPDLDDTFSNWMRRVDPKAGNATDRAGR